MGSNLRYDVGIARPIPLGVTNIEHSQSKQISSPAICDFIYEDFEFYFYCRPRARPSLRHECEPVLSQAGLRARWQEVLFLLPLLRGEVQGGSREILE